MKVTVACPTLNRYDLLAQLMVPSLERGTRPPDAYYIIDNGGKLDPMAYGLPTVKTTVYNPGRNMGISAAWNHVYRTVSEHVVFICDDMEIMPRTVELLVAAAEANPETGFFWPTHPHNMFSVYIMQRWAYDKVGPFDEQFYPAYFEDNDYAYRLKLAGVPIGRVPDCGAAQHVGSGTIKAFSQGEKAAHNIAFEANKARYIAKWGGLPHHETFKTPGGP